MIWQGSHEIPWELPKRILSLLLNKAVIFWHFSLAYFYAWLQGQSCWKDQGLQSPLGKSNLKSKNYYPRRILLEVLLELRKTYPFFATFGPRSMKFRPTKHGHCQWKKRNGIYGTRKTFRVRLFAFACATDRKLSTFFALSIEILCSLYVPL